MLYRLAVLGFFKNNWNLETKKEKVFTAEGGAMPLTLAGTGVPQIIQKISGSSEAAS